MKGTIKDGVLHIEVPLNAAPQASGSGKTLLVASSHGTVILDGVSVGGQTVRGGFNFWIPAPTAPAGNGNGKGGSK